MLNNPVTNSLSDFDDSPHHRTQVSKNFNQPMKMHNNQQLTKQELNEFLRSAICSSRYSTSSNAFGAAKKPDGQKNDDYSTKRGKQRAP